MALQNRVTPEGAIVAVAARGMMMGNRGGRLHRPDRTLAHRRWASRRWICCRLDFKGRRRTVMGEGYTELFFLDEATAFAAGHRPCFECRRPEAALFARLFGEALGFARPPQADDMDRRLHAERVDRSGAKRIHRAPLRGLPDGAMFRVSHTIATKRGGRVAAWSHEGYACLPAIVCADDDVVDVLTPPSIVAVLSAGYVPAFHASIEAVPVRSRR